MSTSMDLVQAVEPAREGELGGVPSLGQALALRCSWRSLCRAWFDESPSWLVSLIVHLVVFLMVTSLAAPFAARRDGGSGEISLTVGFAKRTQTSQGPEVTIEPADVSAATEPDDTDQKENDRPVDEKAAESTPSRDEPTTKARPSAASRAPRRADAKGSDPANVEFDRSLRVSPYAALLNRWRPMASMSGVSPPAIPSLRPLTPESLDPEQRALDRIVDDFIAYDIGRLRGAAAVQARQRFAQLGPESIPALVRGLNKAAGIHASCPVGVIASKLVSTLQLANDPSLRQYAIEHIGEGVAESAPHFKRLEALRKNWLGASPMPATVATMVDRLETRQEGELMELMLALSDAPSDTIVAALRSGDPYLGCAAALAILQTRRPWDAQQRAQLRAAVMHYQSTVEQPQMRALAVDARNALH